MYDYKCPVCTRKREVMLKLADLASTVVCVHCGAHMNRQLSAPFVVGDFQPYESPVVPGKIIQGRREHEQHLKETGCRILEPGETASHQRWLARKEHELDSKVEATTDEFISKLDTDSRDKLAAELEGGMTTEYVRG